MALLNLLNPNALALDPSLSPDPSPKSESKVKRKNQAEQQHPEKPSARLAVQGGLQITHARRLNGLFEEYVLLSRPACRLHSPARQA